MPETTFYELGKIAGIGGLSIGFLFFIFRDIIRRNLFQKFTKEQGYKIIRLIIVLSFIIGLVGVMGWIYIEKVSGNDDKQILQAISIENKRVLSDPSTPIESKVIAFKQFINAQKKLKPREKIKVADIDFTGYNFSDFNNSFSNLDLVNVTFNACNFSNIDFSNTSFTNCKFNGINQNLSEDGIYNFTYPANDFILRIPFTPIFFNKCIFQNAKLLGKTEINGALFLDSDIKKIINQDKIYYSTFVNCMITKNFNLLIKKNYCIVYDNLNIETINSLAQTKSDEMSKAINWFVQNETNGLNLYKGENKHRLNRDIYLYKDNFANHYATKMYIESKTSDLKKRLDSLNYLLDINVIHKSHIDALNNLLNSS